MSKRELSKCREWERERRDRLKTCFTALGRLLPCYDPSVVLSKLEILQRAAACIEELQLKNTKYVNCNIGGDVDLHRQETDDLLKLQDRVKKLLSRNEQLANLLRDAGLKVPTECGNVRTFEPRLWSNRITPERAEQLRNKLLEKQSKDQTDNNHKTNERIKRKRKPLQKLKKNNNKKNTNHNKIKKVECLNSEQKKATRNSNKKGQNVVKNINLIKKKKIIRNKKKILNDVPAVVPVTVLGPGTLILANGNVVPVLPPVQQIITPTLVSHAQASVILMRQHSLSLLPALRPKIASGVTRTTTVNKVPIPALSSRHALKSFVQRQQSSATHNHNNGTKSSTTTTTTTILVKKKMAKKVNTNCSVSVASNTTTQPLINTNALLVTTTTTTTPSRINNNNNNNNNSSSSTIVVNQEASEHQKSEMEEMAVKKVAMMPSDNIIINPSMNNKASVSVSYTIDSLCETSNAPSGQFIELQLPSAAQTQMQTIPNVQSKNSSSIVSANDTNQTIDKSDKMAEGKSIENVAKDDIHAVGEMIMKPPSPSPTLPLPPVQTAPTVNVAASPPPHSELSNDIFASLQVPTGGQHPESMSPTAAFLLAFPLVSTLNGGRVTEVLVEDTPDSRQGTPTTLLQIGGPLDTTSQQQAQATGSTSTLRQRQPIIIGATARQSTPPHLLLSSLDGFSFFSSASASKETQQEPQQANSRHLSIPLPPPASNATSYESYNPRACVFEPKKTQQSAVPVAVVTMSQTQYGAYNPFADITPVSRPPPLYTSCTATGNYQQYITVDDKEEKRLLHKDQQHRAPVNWMTDIRQPTSEFFLPPFTGMDNQSFATVPVSEHTKRPSEFVSYEGHHDPHQFSWSSSKQVAPPPPPLPHVPHATSLPTLVGDLALGVERPFADQAKQHRGKDETTGTFLSVSQLVEHAGVHNNKLIEQQRNHRKHHHHHHQQQQQQQQQQQHHHHHQQTHKGHKRHRDKQRQQDYSMDCHHQIQVPAPAALVNRSHRSSYTAEALISSNQQLYGASASATATTHQYSANISNESQPQQSQQHHTSQPQQSQQRQQFPTNAFNYAPSSLLPPAAVGHAPSVEVAVDFGADGFGQHPKVVPPTFENYAVRSSVLGNAHRSSSSYRTPSAPVEDKRRQSKRVSGQGGRYQSVGSSMPMTMTTTSTTCDTPGMSGFPDLGFLSMSGAIASPILPDEFHTSFLTNTAAPSTVPPPVPVPPYHSTVSASTGYAPPAPPPTMPPKHHYGPRQVTADLQPSSSLTNFNLSAIFPEINKPTARLSRSQSSRVNQPEHHPQQQQGSGAGAHAHPQHQRPADVSPAFPSRLVAAPHHHMAQGKASVAISSSSPSFTAYGAAGSALTFSAPPLPFARH